VLLNNDYLVEKQFTAADIVVGGILVWGLKLQMLNSDDILYKYVNNLM
jgi:glutathione S-transferase